jgi:hypothetical protein
MEQFVTKEVVDKAKALLASTTKGWDSGRCMGAMMDLEGNKFGQAHSACHAWVSAGFRNFCKDPNKGYGWATPTGYKKNAKNFLVLTCHKHAMSKASAEATDAIILWMASDDCPFGKYVVNRDDPESLTNHGAIILCGPDGATEAEVMWMCKVLRYTTEGEQALDAWLTLTKGGIKPLLAVLICTYVSTYKGAVFSAKDVCGHVSVFGWANDSYDLQGIIDGEVNREATDTATVFKSSKKVPDRSEVVLKAKARDKATKFCKPFKKSDGWGGEITGNGATAEEMVAAALAWQKELGIDDAEAVFPVAEVAKKPARRRPIPKPDKNTVFLEVDL